MNTVTNQVVIEVLQKTIKSRLRAILYLTALNNKDQKRIDELKEEP